MIRPEKGCMRRLLELERVKEEEEEEDEDEDEDEREGKERKGREGGGKGIEEIVRVLVSVCMRV